MSLGLILIIVLLIAAFGSWPQWDHSRNWGYGPSGGLVGLVLVIVLILVLLHRI